MDSHSSNPVLKQMREMQDVATKCGAPISMSADNYKTVADEIDRLQQETIKAALFVRACLAAVGRPNDHTDLPIGSIVDLEELGLQVIGLIEEGKLSDEPSDAHRYALNLLNTLVDKFGRPEGFKPEDDMLGMLLQIDNVVAGLLARAAQPPSGTEPADAERYRWLRRMLAPSILSRMLDVPKDDLSDSRPEALDMAIDEYLLRAAPTKEAPPPGYHDLADVIAEAEKIPERKAALDAARARIADETRASIECSQCGAKGTGAPGYRAISVSCTRDDCPQRSQSEEGATHD